MRAHLARRRPRAEPAAVARVVDRRRSESRGDRPGSAAARAATSPASSRCRLRSARCGPATRRRPSDRRRPRPRASGAPCSHPVSGGTNTGGLSSSASSTPLGAPPSAHDRIRLTSRAGQAHVVREVAVAADRAPRRHAPLENLFLDRHRPRPRFLVGRERHRHVAVGVALEALPLEDLRDLAVEDDVGRDRTCRV